MGCNYSIDEGETSLSDSEPRLLCHSVQSPEPEVRSNAKIILVGNAGTGKSCLVRQYAEDGSFDPSSRHTIGVEYYCKTVEFATGHAPLKLQMWDTAGQERFRAIVQSYFRGAEGVFLIYAINDRESFETIHYWKKNVDSFLQVPPKIFLIGNKSDLEGERVVSFEEGQNLAAELGIHFLEVSAKREKNIERMFEDVAGQIRGAFTFNVKRASRG